MPDIIRIECYPSPDDPPEGRDVTAIYSTGERITCHFLTCPGTSEAELVAAIEAATGAYFDALTEE